MQSLPINKSQLLMKTKRMRLIANLIILIILVILSVCALKSMWIPIIGMSILFLIGSIIYVSYKCIGKESDKNKYSKKTFSSFA